MLGTNLLTTGRRLRKILSPSLSVSHVKTPCRLHFLCFRLLFSASTLHNNTIMCFVPADVLVEDVLEVFFRMLQPRSSCPGLWTRIRSCQEHRSFQILFSYLSSFLLEPALKLMSFMNIQSNFVEGSFKIGGSSGVSSSFIFNHYILA